ncbi:PREDICTED: serine/arginine-rich splicing factor 7-like isoform X1 [Branchiostoma belcheri]|uniref:Serine/arginine-rich splicing factor 7-like isoform X1 n=1 Tax=Branchiostoma belcheri TaxID=7741 RepID=A0A6P4Z0Z5_BRABE|nr:PREDICTED: serine/arginine-rich splicing factor 7-like isoform X1 [Branchiostoma belcheri]
MSRYGRDPRDQCPLDCKVYVGDLGTRGNERELRDIFSYYGPLRNVWVARNPPGFAFVEFEDPRDAKDAVKHLDRREICGAPARVEMSTARQAREAREGMGGGRRSRYGPPPPYYRRPFDPLDRCYECGERGHYARDCYRYRRRRFSSLSQFSTRTT